AELGIRSDGQAAKPLARRLQALTDRRGSRQRRRRDQRRRARAARRADEAGARGGVAGGAQREGSAMVYCPLKAETRVRIPLGPPTLELPVIAAFPPAARACPRRQTGSRCPRAA